MKQLGKTLWPILSIVLLVVVISIANYRSGTTLMGGDNLMPEFNFPVNIQRSLFAVWQEYQGLGLLGGMGHASDLLRQIILLIASTVIPTNLLRYIWTMSMLGLGGVGAYFLMYHLLQNHATDKKKAALAALIGGMFYILNLATVQSFYVPFEVFTAHFGFLPWLLYSALLYVEKGTKKTLIFASVILLFATPAAYVPTLFLVYIIALSVLVGVLLLFSLWTKQNSIEKSLATNQESRITQTKKKVFIGNWKLVIRNLKLYIIVFLINAFWLLPFMYFTITNSTVVVNAKINQMATEKVFFQNKEFGDIADTLLLKGFWINNVNPTPDGNTTYQLLPWRNYFNYPWVPVIGYAFFAVILFGIITGLRSKKPPLIAWIGVFIFTFIILATNTFPFSWIDDVMRNYVPLFKQVFRFPYTKFSILASLAYAVFFSIGINTIISFTKNKISQYSIVFCSMVLLIIFVFPIFQGNFFYYKERIAIPNDYSQLFTFFQHQDPSERIADFPQDVFWGWTYTKWNYDGSGFLWYGIQQPILDRAFDVWNSNNENYYWELSTIQSKNDPLALKKLLNKYQVTWLIIDRNTFYAYNPALDVIIPLQNLFSKIPQINKAATFGNIDVYKFDLDQKPTTDITIKDHLPTINGYQWNNNDTAYQTYGDYQTQQNNQIVYPFRSLFTNKSQSDIASTIQEKNQTITIQKTLQQEVTNPVLNLPVMRASHIPVTITAHIEKGGPLDVNFAYKTPQVIINNNTPIWQEEASQTIFRISKNVSYPLNITINGNVNFPLSYTNETLGSLLIYTNQDTIIKIQEANQKAAEFIVIPANTYALPPIYHQTEKISVPTLKKDTSIQVVTPNIPANVIAVSTAKNNVTNCNSFRNGTISAANIQGMLQLSGTNATPCLSYYADNMYYDNGYFVTFSASHQEGQALHFWMDNPALQSSPIDTLLPTANQIFSTQFVISPVTVSGKGYGLHFDEDSYGNGQTSNSFGTISVYPIPYDFLTDMKITEPNASIDAHPSSIGIITTHPNASLYTVRVESKASLQKDTTIILSQSYDSGWQMYQVSRLNWFSEAFPFLAGKNITNHVLVNNWENGWDVHAAGLQGNTSFIIVYLPQYLEYAGFLLLLGTFGSIIFLMLKKDRKSHGSKRHLF